MQPLGEMLRGAVGLHQQGRLAEAEQLYSKVLEVDARQFDALHLLGLLKHQRGDSVQALRLIGAALEANPGSLEALLNYGGVLSAMNRQEDALACYDRALAIKPDYAGAHYNRGNALMELGRHAEALVCYDRALALKPNDPLALYNRGNALAELNRSDEALAAYDKVLALAPSHPDALINRGKALKNLNRSEEALACFDEVLALRPNDVLAHINRGLALVALDRSEDALIAYDRALALRPDNTDALHNRGAALIQLDRHAEALACCDRALALNPGDDKTLINRGIALVGLNHPEEALACYDQVLERAPDDADALNNRGAALLRLNRHEEALECYDRALELRPNDTSTLNNCGNALVLLHRPKEALTCFDRALALNPGDTETLHNRGNALLVADRYQEALACFDQALVLKPDHAKCHCDIGLARLALGDFAQGWKEYEWRWKTADFLARPRDFAQPRWNGEYVNKTLLAWGEQGLGDEILYSSMVPDLAGHADSVALEVEPRLVKLFARSFPGVRVIGRGKLLPDNIKAQSPLASLGQYLRPSLDAFPRRERGYLIPDAGMAASLRRRLSPNGEVVVGLSWISKNPAMGKFKTALLNDFDPVLRLPGCQLIDLQYGDTLAEREALKQATGLVVERLEDVDNINDLDALAALITACDLVVTVSNTTAHLAGALGKPTIVFVPFGQARLWYWFHEGDDSPWYARVRLKRQAKGQSWADIAASAAAEISALVRTAQIKQPA